MWYDYPCSQRATDYASERYNAEHCWPLENSGATETDTQYTHRLYKTRARAKFGKTIFAAVHCTQQSEFLQSYQVK
jgi:hypothetical protein